MSEQAETARKLLPLIDAATGPLLASADNLDEAAVREPSLLPNWTRAHVLSHLVNNADAHRAMAEGAARGEVVLQYPGGHPQRERDIMANAHWPASRLITELHRACDQLRRAWGEMPEAGWANLIGRPSGPVEAWIGLRFRLQECEVHHIDLDVGYGIERWSGPFVDAILPHAVSAIAGRAAEGPHGRWNIERSDGDGSWAVGSGELRGRIRGSGRDLLAWALGRSGAEGLDIDGDQSVGGAIPRAYPYG